MRRTRATEIIFVLANRVHPSKFISGNHCDIRNGMCIIDCREICCELKKISQTTKRLLCLLIVTTKGRLASWSSFMLANGIARFSKRVLLINSSLLVWMMTNYSGTALDEIISEIPSQGFFVNDNNLLVLENNPDVIVESSSVNKRCVNSNKVM